MSDIYDYKTKEKHWQQSWLEGGVYSWNEEDSLKEGDLRQKYFKGETTKQPNTFVIDTPPPTVSGVLHMGHIFSYTQADFIARFQRMMGKNVFYPMGFDDNGLPTERLVEKITGRKAHTYESRAEFIEVCKQHVAQAEEQFRDLFKSIALSVDWKLEYQTISALSRTLSQASFLDLYNKGLLERRLEPVFWDTVDRTAIALAEVEDRQLESRHNYIKFQLDTGEDIFIYTTRPELLPACVAVMYHPDDKHLYEGKFALTALFNVKVPLIADEKVDKTKGTGLVMLCTFGDETDKYWFDKYKNTHNLPLRVIINKEGKSDVFEIFRTIKDEVEDKPILKKLQKYNGFKVQPTYQPSGVISDVFEKRQDLNKVITQDLAEAGLLYESNLETPEAMPPKKETFFMHTVKVAERSQAPLELIPSHQWFIKIEAYKKELKQQAEKCNWHPSFMKQRVESWIDGLKQDWCVSRQRYFGVPVPMEYDAEESNTKTSDLIIYSYQRKEIPPKISQLPFDPIKDKKPENIADSDVLDTWATSSISPQLNSWGISDAINDELATRISQITGKDTTYIKARQKALFPADLRPQAHEIIRSWAFYTIVKALHHQETIPWKNLMISGWCLAKDKTKMSKSKGNVITPIELIEQHGSDAVRYWASTSRLGTDTAFSEDLLKIGRKLVNKLWNATKFASIHFSKLQKGAKATEKIDQWIISRLNKTITSYIENFEKYEYATAREVAEDFFWNTFCDNYLEIIKKRIYNEDGLDNAGEQSAIYTVKVAIEVILKLFAPFVPHITEELYSSLYSKASIHSRGSMPSAKDFAINENAENLGQSIINILNEVRKAKADAKVSLKYEVKELKISGVNKELLEGSIEDLKAVTNSLNIEIVGGEEFLVKVEF
ncbi:MAG: valine--tRNA ligase [Alphaproteobacteria bacterium]|jgi:valyl-tRNA synthetase